MLAVILLVFACHPLTTVKAHEGSRSLMDSFFFFLVSLSVWLSAWRAEGLLYVS